MALGSYLKKIHRILWAHFIIVLLSYQIGSIIFMVPDPGKCSNMLFGSKGKLQKNLPWGKITFKYSWEEKVLGIAIDSKLKFSLKKALLRLKRYT